MGFKCFRDNHWFMFIEYAQRKKWYPEQAVQIELQY